MGNLFDQCPGIPQLKLMSAFGMTVQTKTNEKQEQEQMETI
jgi:hypothetical protein